MARECTQAWGPSFSVSRTDHSMEVEDDSDTSSSASEDVPSTTASVTSPVVTSPPVTSVRSTAAVPTSCPTVAATAPVKSSTGPVTMATAAPVTVPSGSVVPVNAPSTSVSTASESDSCSDYKFCPYNWPIDLYSCLYT
ncbi:threonine-rich protein-like [Acropora muricata]|uniref:threonine-rich protein-like n=1 Tax=Acropora muricata TaxID=159855 RepID=UPI0034E3E4C7